jgi:hypothetical protein
LPSIRIPSLEEEREEVERKGARIQIRDPAADKSISHKYKTISQVYKISPEVPFGDCTHKKGLLYPPSNRSEVMKFDVVHSTTTHNNSPTPVTNLLRGEEGNILSLIRKTNFGALRALF